MGRREALAGLGLTADGFGGTVLRTGYPAQLGKKPPRAMPHAVADSRGSKERPPGREQLLGDMVAQTACRAAARAGDRLAPQGTAALLARRELTRGSRRCPHSRPAVLRPGRRDLERLFRRTRGTRCRRR